MSDHPSVSRGASRRTFLGGLAAMGAAVILPGCCARDRQGDLGCVGTCPTEFMIGASKLTGITLSASYTQLAAQLWAELITLQGSDDLYKVIALAASTDSDETLQHRLDQQGLMPSAQRIIRAWYTGMVEIPDSGRPGLTTTKVVTYNEAVAWEACHFTKPPATCGGAFGTWNLAPQG